MDQLREHIRDGLVVLDTNSLLDTYRFTEAARNEYLAALELLGDRLWIPHRVGEEFLDRRISVITELGKERETAHTKLTAELTEPANVIAWYARRRGATGERATELIERFRQSAHDTLSELDGDEAFEAPPALDPDLDPVLLRIERLTHARIGGELDTKTLAGLYRTWSLRLAARVPPGYADEKKGDRAIGDFLIWEQTLREATQRHVPVLLVTNDHKPDWVRRDGKLVGPRPELVQEMLRRAGQRFHLVDVHTFLNLAREYLAADVSAETVVEATLLASAEVTPSLDDLADLWLLLDSSVSEKQPLAEALRNRMRSRYPSVDLVTAYSRTLGIDPELLGRFFDQFGLRSTSDDETESTPGDLDPGDPEPL
ncbi:PIN-like domain-containing protein [Nocardia niigatensis]